MALHALYISSPSFVQRVDVHLVVSPFDRQFNAWRNIARLFARTTYVMMLDVDFAVCTDWRVSVLDLLHRKDREYADPLSQLFVDGHAALVVPAFEYTDPDEGADATEFPRSKQVRA
jgi:hypothetical protein